MPPLAPPPHATTPVNSPPFQEEVFIELMETATRSVEFSFNNEMYKQIDREIVAKN